MPASSDAGCTTGGAAAASADTGGGGGGGAHGGVRQQHPIAKTGTALKSAPSVIQISFSFFFGFIESLR
jgi:hypothetical protein